MACPTRISVVTPSFNQGKFLGRTIDSVLAQEYPNLEHIVVDGMSGDETPAVLARYPHLRVVREPDRGQADAINKGFRLASGDVLCFLNSDDTYLPGTLHRVAREIDPARGRHVVTGGCIYIDENDTPTGLMHPAGSVGHRRILKVWKAHCVPQPATFWTAEAWRNCGPLAVGEQLVLDYDLMCRLSQRYRFHFIDGVLATYRLHGQSKSCTHSAGTIYDQAIRVSRRYWGSPARRQYWQLLASLAEHRLEQKLGRRRLAAALAVCGHAACRRGRWLRGAVFRLGAAVLAPAVAGRRRRLCRRGPAGGEGPLTRAWRDFTGMHPDRWVGPTFVTALAVRPGQRWLCLEGGRLLGLPRDLRLEAAIDGHPAGGHRAAGGDDFSWRIPLAGLGPGGHRLTVRASSFVVPHDYLGNEDYRPLSFRLQRLELSDAPAPPVPAGG